jgi:succinoglycan biosynthesis transport protein ExoP
MMADLVEEDDDVRAADLRDYGRTVWRHRKLVAITAIVAIGAAIALSLVQTATYQATAELIIQPAGSQSLTGGTQQSSDDEARDVATQVAVLQSSVIQDAATKALGHTPAVTISSDSSTSDVISVVARSSKGAGAANDANGYARTYITYSRQQGAAALVRAGQQVQASLNTLELQIAKLPSGSSQLAGLQQQQTLLQQQLNQIRVSGNLNQVGGASMLAAATVPGSPVSPKPIRNGAIALILGILLGLGLAFLREFLDDKITTREDLERAAGGLAVLGQIPRVESWREATNRLVTLDPTDGEEAAAEAYRTLRTSIQFLGVDEPLKIIQVTSAESAEGKTVTVANLAVAFASAGMHVAVVCCDLRRPRMHELFRLPNNIGFTSVLRGEVSAFDALQVIADHPNLAVLSAGPATTNPSELLGSERAREAIAALATTADLVLIDCPPVLPVSDALIVSGMTDGTILVASAGSTTRRSLQRALELLHQVDAPVVGTVLNHSEPLSSTGYASYPNASSNGTNGAHAAGHRVSTGKRVPS